MDHTDTGNNQGSQNTGDNPRTRQTIESAWTLYIDRMAALAAGGGPWEKATFTVSEAGIDLGDDRLRTLIREGRKVGVILVVTAGADITRHPAIEEPMHAPCCAVHQLSLDCDTYRRTHVVEAGHPCCDTWTLSRPEGGWAPRGCPAGFSSKCPNWTSTNPCRCLLDTLGQRS